MATTIPEPLKPGHDVRLEPIHAAYVEALGDYDKADDEVNNAYYTGLVDAYYTVLKHFDAIETDPTVEG